ncbi:class I SAM-dependent methyltransferase [Pseudomonas umsongensis]|jgi:ubiquinone/menaquinone biosynthesis C-methylase UbiE|uniref:class I SAM-dependent methyltransferase n=1 Tax=Pseudomonas umsongensis TaxID=198618 RepID=UPI003D7FC0EF
MDRPLSTAYANKSEIYDSARPSYPQEAILFIQRQLDLSLGLPVLDVGSGTGILTRQLAATGMPMIGIEPDANMLAKARANTGQPSASYRSGTAEQLGGAPRSVAALVCGQSFHWFEPGKTRTEFRRVLATNNPVILIWNIRSPDCNAFHRAYEQLLNDAFARYAETLQIDEALESRIQQFFNGPFEERIFHNSQQLSVSSLLERTMSCSYAMKPRTLEYRNASHALNILHQQYQQNGFVSLNYETRVVYGRI